MTVLAFVRSYDVCILWSMLSIQQTRNTISDHSFLINIFRYACCMFEVNEFRKGQLSMVVSILKPINKL